MLDIRFIRENPDTVKWACKVKNFDDHVDDIIALDARVRELKTITEKKTAEKNKISASISASESRAELIEKSKNISDEIAGDVAELEVKEAELQELLLNVPNIPSTDSPIGPDESYNKVVAETGSPKKFNFAALNHWEILDKNHWWIGDKISEISGSRGYTLTGEAAEMDLALQTFVIQKLIKQGFIFMSMPAVTKPQSVFNAGHFKGSDPSVMNEDVFMLAGTDKCLAGTAEIILNSVHAGEILDESMLPVKYAGYSHCFRKEAGASGRDTRGLVRVHEFHKVEQYVYCTPEQTEEMYQMLLKNLREIFTDLEVAHHVLDLSTGDMGFNKFKTCDVEAWIPGGARWVEVGSCSAIGEFQARRTNTRFRAKDGTTRFCATLNNTAIALPRALAVILENHQNADGSVNVPEALRGFMGGREKIGG